MVEFVSETKSLETVSAEFRRPWRTPALIISEIDDQTLDGANAGEDGLEQS